MDQFSELGLDSGLGGGAFEPQQRARSNTWPLPRPDNFPDEKDDMELDQLTEGDEGTPIAQGGLGSVGNGTGGGLPPKKNSSRRNAWGNMSYADLITQAITSAPEKRLTLSQIYDWMVQHVPYFKDKGDSNSSAGWKNSIRHNLSLHNRFMRVQNEGAGKSSWWMINQDARPGKAARRRAASMETQKFEKKRGRVRKKLEAMINGTVAPDTTPSPSSSVSEGLDMYPDSPLANGSMAANGSASFQLSPDFRPRASSNASSTSRLSPIPSLEQDNQGPSLSPTSWNNDMMGLYGGQAPPAYPDLDNMKLCDSIAEAMTLNDPLPPLKQNTTYSSSSFYNIAPPLYADLARSGGLDVSSGRVKLEVRDIVNGSPHFNGGIGMLSAAVKPPPTIPESQEMPCGSPDDLEPLLTRMPASNGIQLVDKTSDSLNSQSPPSSLAASLGSVASQLRGHILTSSDDLNFDSLDTLQGGLECDVDQVGYQLLCHPYS